MFLIMGSLSQKHQKGSRKLMPDCLPGIEWSENKFFRSSKLCGLWQRKKSAQVSLEGGTLDQLNFCL
jgi:hypothetical protein